MSALRVRVMYYCFDGRTWPIASRRKILSL